MICIAAPQLLVVAAGKTCHRGEGLRNIVLDSGRCENFMTSKTGCQDLVEKNVAFRPYESMSGEPTTWTTSSKPKGCFISVRQYDNTLVREQYNVNYLSTSTTNCSSQMKCICADTECTPCPRNYYSNGGMDARCIKCPSDRPYTCIGEDCTGTGATIDSCQASPKTCKPGEGLQGDSIGVREIGPCDNYIATEQECEQAAVLNQPADGNSGRLNDIQMNYWIGSREDYPKGCIAFWTTTSTPTLRYYFNGNMQSTRRCSSTYKCVCKPKTCAPCPANYYSEGGGINCTKCPLFFGSLPGATGCMDIGTIALLKKQDEVIATLKNTCSASANNGDNNGRRLNTLCGKGITDKDSKQNSNINNNDDDDVSKDSDNKDSKQNGNINNDDDVSKDSDNKDSKQNGIINNDDGVAQQQNNNDNEMPTLVTTTVIILVALALLSCGGFILYTQIYKKKHDAKIKLQNRNTWDMNAIELNQRNEQKKTSNKFTLDVNSSGNNIDDNVKKFELNPVRTSAVGFPVEDLLPIINKKSKTSQKSVLKS